MPPRVVASSFQNQILKGDAFESYGLLTPSFTAPGVAAEPVLWVPAAVLAPEVLASPPGEAGACGALVHGARLVLHRALRRAGPDIALARRTVTGLGAAD